MTHVKTSNILSKFCDVTLACCNNPSSWLLGKHCGKVSTLKLLKSGNSFWCIKKVISEDRDLQNHSLFQATRYVVHKGHYLGWWHFVQNELLQAYIIKYNLSVPAPT